MNLFETGGATFSDDAVYRYRLWRRWNEDHPTIAFVMLNPSTADADRNDPTIERCCRRVRHEGWGGLIVLNLFALRSTDPKRLYSHPDPVGPENDRHIVEVCSEVRDVVCAWGAHGAHLGRARRATELIRKVNRSVWSLGVNSDGSPKHPLYVPYSQEMRQF